MDWLGKYNVSSASKIFGVSNGRVSASTSEVKVLMCSSFSDLAKPAETNPALNGDMRMSGDAGEQVGAGEGMRDVPQDLHPPQDTIPTVTTTAVSTTITSRPTSRSPPPPERKSKLSVFGRIFKPWKWKRRKKPSEKIERIGVGKLHTFVCF